MSTEATSPAERAFDDVTSDYERAKSFATDTQSSAGMRRQARFATEHLAEVTTIPRAELKRKASSDNVAHGMEIELSRLRGVITRVTEDIIEVAFEQPRMEVAFPALLLGGTELARYGQSVDYVVRQRADGYRYQSFIAATAEHENPFTKQLEELLSVIDDG